MVFLLKENSDDDLDKLKENKLVKRMLNNFKDSTKIYTFWKWDKKDVKEFIMLTILVLFVAYSFYFLGRDYQCYKDSNGGRLGTMDDNANEVSFFSFKQFYKADCIPKQCWQNPRPSCWTDYYFGIEYGVNANPDDIKTLYILHNNWNKIVLKEKYNLSLE